MTSKGKLLLSPLMVNHHRSNIICNLRKYLRRNYFATMATGMHVTQYMIVWSIWTWNGVQTEVCCACALLQSLSSSLLKSEWNLKYTTVTISPFILTWQTCIFLLILLFNSYKPSFHCSLWHQRRQYIIFPSPTTGVKALSFPLICQ